jgi:hypothetical protein
MGAELIIRRLGLTAFLIASCASAWAQESAPAAQPSNSYLESSVALVTGATDRVGAFISEQTQKAQLSVYGCLTGSSGPICSAGSKADHIFLRQSSVTSGPVSGVGAVGLGGDLHVMNRIRVSGELVWQPYMAARANDTSWTTSNLSGIREAAVGGAGFKTEWVLSYDFTNALSAGLGGRYAVASPEVVDSRFGALAPPKGDQRSFGAFFQLNYRFGQNLLGKAR